MKETYFHGIFGFFCRTQFNDDFYKNLLIVYLFCTSKIPQRIGQNKQKNSIKSLKNEIKKIYKILIYLLYLLRLN